MGMRRITDGVYKVRARIRVNGKIVQKQTTLTGSTREEAKAAVEKLKAELRATDNTGRSLIIKTFGDALSFYIDRHEVGSSRSLFNRLKADLGTVEIRELADRFDSYLQILKKSKAQRTGRPLANGTINRYLSWAKASINFAVLHGLLKDNPLRNFGKLKEIPRDRILTADEQARLLTTLEREAPHLLAAVNFALRIPCRTNEIVNMRRQHLNLFKNTITVPGEFTKNGQPCLKLIPPDMIDYFRTLPKETDFLFFRQNKKGYHPLGSFRKSWRRALKIAGINDFVFHSLRHCAVTSLRNSGTPDHVIHILAGWKNGDYMMKTYYSFKDERMFDLVRFPGQCENKRENQKVNFG
jgi:integrase